MDPQTRQRKNLGAFYTPSYLAKSLTEAAITQFLMAQLNSQTHSKFLSLEEMLNTPDLMIIEKLKDILKELKILDGSVGDGEFLKACLTTIRSIEEKIEARLSINKVPPNEAFLNILHSNLFGMEIDSESVSRCHKNLGTVIPNLNLPSVSEILHTNILTGDFLESSLSNWPKLPPATDGFDIVLGNPPWGGKLTKIQREHYYNKFKLKSPKRNLNTFSLFVYQATNLLNPNNGMLAYLLPKNVARSNQYTYLRRFLVTNFQILSINFHGLFQDVTQEFISIIGLHKNKIPSEHVILIDAETRVPQASYLTNIDNIFTKEFDSQSTLIIRLINENSSHLAQFLTIRRGEELSKQGGIMFCPNCTEWVPLSSRKPLIVCSICKQPLNESNLKTEFLITKQPTSQHTQPILTGDDFEAYKIHNTHFIDPTAKFRSKKNPSIYTSPKIVIQKIKPYLCAAHDSNGYWTTQNVYNLILKPDYRNKPDLLYFILSVLNSSLYRWFYESQFNLGSKYTNAISIRNLRRLPLKNPDFNDPLFHQIVQLAKKIIKEHASVRTSIQQIDKFILQYYQCETLPLPNFQ